MGQHGIDTGDLFGISCDPSREYIELGKTYIHALLLLDVRIHHLSVVQHYGPPAGAAIRRPAQLFGETGIGIRQKELDGQ